MSAVLDPEVHKRLIDEMEGVCQKANVPRVYVQTSMRGSSPEQDIEWMKSYPTLQEKGQAGLVFEGSTNAETRMMAMAGAFLRQFVDAQIHSLNSLLDSESAYTMPDPTVLFIPNLFVRAYGKALPAWKIQSIYDLLLSRYTSGKVTVCYVESLLALGDSYGKVFHDHLLSHYRVFS